MHPLFLNRAPDGALSASLIHWSERLSSWGSNAGAQPRRNPRSGLHDYSQPCRLAASMEIKKGLYKSLRRLRMVRSLYRLR